MIILTAMQQEYEIARKLFGTDYEIRRIGVGPRNAIRAAKRLLDERVPCNTEVMLFGFAGSNNLPLGTFVYASDSAMHCPLAKYEDPFEQMMPLARPSLPNAPTLGVPCFTSADFVTETRVCSPAIFDMELGFMAELWPSITAWRIVSDNLDGDEFKEFLAQDLLTMFDKK